MNFAADVTAATRKNYPHKKCFSISRQLIVESVIKHNKKNLPLQETLNEI